MAVHELEDIFQGFTQRERDYCLFYIGEAKFNGVKAAEMAGYANPLTEGTRLKKREHVIDAIGRLMARRNEALDVNAKWVLLRLVEVELDATLNKNRKDRLRALELIGKHVDVAAFREQHGLGGLNGEALNPGLPLETLSEEELDQLERISRKLYGAAAAGGAAIRPSALPDRTGEGAPEGGG